MKMKTTEGFIIDYSKEGKSKDFAWFVRHEKLNDGKSMPIDRGSLEHYLTKSRKKIMEKK